MIRILIAALMFAISAPAMAQVYLFGMGSNAKADTRTTPATTGSDTTSFHVGAGWRFNKYVAAEVGYLGLGHYGAASASWTAKGIGMSAVGTLPITGPWALVGKVGVYQLDSELAICCTTVTKEDLGSRPLIAFGGQYHVGDALHLQLLVQRIAGKTGTSLDNIKMLSIGAALAF